MKFQALTKTVLVLIGITASMTAVAQGTAFTYQGHLNASGAAAHGIYDLRFTVYDSSGGANVVAGPLTGSGVGVTNGLFTVTLDFGSGVLTGPPRWLQIAVRTNGAATFTNLSPRQALTASPYAIHAGMASNVVNGAVVKSLNNLRDNITLAAGANVTLTPSGNTLTIAATGAGNNLWSLNGSNTYYNAGNVGIGTMTPHHRLSISGGAYWTDELWSGALELDNSSAIGWRANSAGNRFGMGQSTAGFYFFTTASDPGTTVAPPRYLMNFDDAGKVGIGVLSPQSKLHVYEQEASVSHLIETGGGINAWARVAFKNLNGQWDVGTSRGFNNDVFYIDRSGTPPLEFQLSATGLLGLGIEPQSKLHLYEANNSVSQRIQTGGGVNAWTRLELINANGQWDIGTSRGFNGDQLYFSRQGGGIALGLQPDGDAFLTGNAVQGRDKGGWVKAMAKVNADGSIARQFSAFGGTITGAYSIGYLVTFPFQVNDRFIQLTPFLNQSVAGVTANITSFPSANSVLIHVRSPEIEAYVANEFFIFVY